MDDTTPEPRPNDTKHSASEPSDPLDSLGEVGEIWSRRDNLGSAADAVHQTLREAILTGLLPPGMRLGEEELARQFAVSRTPVREAVLRLQGERLAARTARGLVVTTISRSEILELYVVRVAIDGLAAKLAAGAAGIADVTGLRWVNRQMGIAADNEAWEDLADLNLDFHEMLCRAGHNSVLIDVLLSIHDKVRRFPGTTLSAGDRATEAVREHAEIIAAIEARDGGAAEVLARRHMDKAMEIRVGMLFSADA